MILGRQIAYDSPIDLADLLFVFLEHFIQPGEGFTGACKNHYTADRTIHPVGDTQINLSRFVVFLLDIRLYFFAQRGISGFICLYNVRNFLIDGNDMIIFV